MLICCHTPTRQIDHASTNHQLHRQRYTPECIISILCVFAKSVQNQSIQWVLWDLKGMYPGTRVVSQASQSIAMHSQGKWNIPVVIINSVDIDTHHNTSFLPSAVLPNLPKTSPSNGHYGVCGGCILACRSCRKLVNPLPHTHKVNEIYQHQPSAPWTQVHTTMCHFCPVHFP